MLGLGSSLACHYPPLFTPESVSNLVVWLKVNRNITADVNDAGATLDPVRSTAAGNLVNLDRINAWNAYGSTSINAVQTTFGDRPRWTTVAADLGALWFKSNIKWMDLSSTVTIPADTDFSVVVRFKRIGTAGAFMGSSNVEKLALVDAKTFRLKIDGSTARSFAESSDEIADDTYYTMIVSRTNGSTGDLNVYINGGSYTDKDWDAAEDTADAAEFVISNIASSADDTDKLQVYFKDVLIYNGTALSKHDRARMYAYLDAQI